jgi:hypothetical protein
MRSELKKELDKELVKHRFRNLKIVLIVFLILSSFMVIFGGFINGEKTAIIGIVESHYVRLHDEGHDLNVMVKIPNPIGLVRIKIPKNSNLKIGSKVEVTKTTSLLFNISRYRFFKYVG